MDHDSKYIIKGLDAIEPIPNISVGKLIFEALKSKISKEPFIIDASSSRVITFNEVLIKSVILAKYLKNDLNCFQSTVIGICSENCTEFCIPLLSGLLIGVPITTFNHSYSSHEFSYVWNIAKPSILFCSKNAYEKFIKTNSTNSIRKCLKKIILIDSDEKQDEIVTLSELIKVNLPSSLSVIYNFEPVTVDVAQDVAFILYSSGTTGLPKGVMLTHRNVLVKFVHSMDPRWASDFNTLSLCILPFYHAYGLFISLLFLKRFKSLVTMKQFNPILFLGCIEKYKIAELNLVPPLAVFLTKNPIVGKYDLSSVKEITCGAAPLAREIEDELIKRFKVRNVRQGYGMTETTLGVTASPLDSSKFGSCGKLLPFISCKVRDIETGRALGPNQVGEFCIKGPLVMKGYYGNEEATKNAFSHDGWLLTGDLGYYDEDEYFYVVDRLKELIKYKAFQVPPAEIEAILLRHPKILDAGVVGLPDEDSGELPLAFIVKAPNSNLSEKEVVDFVGSHVSPQKRLRGGVIFVSAIPKNPSGKILRRELRNLLKKYKAKL